MRDLILHKDPEACSIWFSLDLICSFYDKLHVDLKGNIEILTQIMVCKPFLNCGD